MMLSFIVLFTLFFGFTSGTAQRKNFIAIPKYTNYHSALFPEEVSEEQVCTTYALIIEKCNKAKNILACYQKYFPECSLTEIKTTADVTFIGKMLNVLPGDRWLHGETIGYLLPLVQIGSGKVREKRVELIVAP